MNLTHCISSKISDSTTGNYLNFSHLIEEDNRHEIYPELKPNLVIKKDSRNKKKSRSSYMCRKCRAHGQLLPVKNHRRNCPFKLCPCPLCTVVSHGRDIVARQIRLYRNQKDGNKRAPQSPHCRRCRNHGEHNAWKGHKKKCRHSNCPCKLCLLITMRKSNEKSYREIIQEVNEDKTVKTVSNSFGIASRSKDSQIIEDQSSSLIRSINRPNLLSPNCSSIYDNMPNNSIYAQHSILNFPPPTENNNCPLKALNWSNSYKMNLSPWDSSGSFDMQPNTFCSPSHLNNMVMTGNGLSNSTNNNTMEYLPSASSAWYQNFY